MIWCWLEESDVTDLLVPLHIDDMRNIKLGDSRIFFMPKW